MGTGKDDIHRYHLYLDFPATVHDTKEERLKPPFQVLQADYPLVSYADLYQMAAAVSIEHAGGPKIDMKYGRKALVERTPGMKVVAAGWLNKIVFVASSFGGFHGQN